MQPQKNGKNIKKYSAYFVFLNCFSLAKNILVPTLNSPVHSSDKTILCVLYASLAYRERAIKVLANEDTLLRTHCCRHKCFPVCPRAQHLLRTQILCPGHKNVSDFVQKHFVSATNVPQFAQPKKHHEQQCVRNNVSSFTRALKVPLIMEI